MKQSTASLRLPRATYDRLSALAGEHCLTRPKMVALLLERGPPPVDVEPGRALELLAESAEAGSVTARVALARLLHRPAKESPVEDPLAELDALARRRDRA